MSDREAADPTAKTRSAQVGSSTAGGPKSEGLFWKRRRFSRAFGLGLILGVVLGLFMGATLFSLQAKIQERRKKRWTPYRKLVEFAKVLHHIEKDYVDDVDSEKLVHGAIQGMLDRLDPHSRFFPKELYRRLLAAATGVYAGIGVVLESRSQGIFIKKVQPGGPAQKAGLRSGDRLVGVKGKLVGQRSLQGVVEALRGKSRSTVRVSVSRRGWRRPRVFRLQRVVMRKKSVIGRVLFGNIAYVRVRAFHPGTAKEIHATLLALQKKIKASSGSLKKLVIDLRNNPGGLMSEALRAADLFVANGLLISRRGKKGRLQEKYWAASETPWRHLELAVLIDGRTASAAEILAAALKDNKKASVVGRRSFGKGTFQELIRFSEGSVLKLTVGRYYTPSGKSLDGVGVKPSWRVLTGPLPPGTPVPQKLPAELKADAPLVIAVGVLTQTMAPSGNKKNRI